MTRKLIILLYGNEGVGKDYIANLIMSKDVPTKRYAFADNLKLKAKFDFNYKEADKELYRDALIKTADKVKNEYGQAVFANMVINDIYRDTIMLPFVNTFIITDLRFLAELKAINGLEFTSQDQYTTKIIEIKTSNDNVNYTKYELDRIHNWGNVTNNRNTIINDRKKADSSLLCELNDIILGIR